MIHILFAGPITFTPEEEAALTRALLLFVGIVLSMAVATILWAVYIARRFLQHKKSEKLLRACVWLTPLPFMLFAIMMWT